MVLNNTLILPGDNPALSQKLLTSLIQGQDKVILIIFGKDARAEDAIQKADVRASAIVSGISRKAVWMQDTGMITFLKTLLKSGADFNVGDIDPASQIGISVSMTDVLKDLIPQNPAPDFVRMELAFMNASTLDQ